VRIKFYADTPNEKNKYFVFKICETELDFAQVRLIKKHNLKIRACWLEKILDNRVILNKKVPQYIIENIEALTSAEVQSLLK